MWAKFDCNGGDAYAELDGPFGGPGPYWVQIDVWIPSTTLTACGDGDLFGQMAYVLALLATSPITAVTDSAYAKDDNFPAGTGWNWWTNYGGDTGVALTTGTTHTVKMHWDGTNTNWYIDGSLVATNNPSPFVPAGGIRIGGYFSENCSCEWYFVSNVKIGSSDGSSDIFSDDFSSADFSNWTSTTGSCAVVAAPSTCGGGAATASIDPTAACQGTTVTVTGSGFDDSSPITVTFDGQPVDFSEADSDSSGNISGTFDIPWGITACTACTYNIVVSTGGGATATVVFDMCCGDASDVPDDSLPIQLGDYAATTAPLSFIRFDGAYWFVVRDDSALTGNATLPPPTNHSLNVVRVDDFGTTTVYPVDTGYAWNFNSTFFAFHAVTTFESCLWFDGWAKPIYDAKLATDGTTLMLFVLTAETVVYPYISTDDNHDGHPSQASQFVDLATMTAGFTFFPRDCTEGESGPTDPFHKYILTATGTLNTYTDNPPYSDGGDNWFGYWSPPLLVGFSFDGFSFNRIDTEPAKYCPGSVAADGNAFSGTVGKPTRYNAGHHSNVFSGISAWASPSQSGVFHVIWAEGGAYGRYGAKDTGDPLGQDLEVWDGNAPDVGYRINYTTWSSAAKTSTADIFSSAIDRRAWYFSYDNGSGVAPYGYTWPASADLAWSNVFQVRNDDGEPRLFLSAQETVVDPSGNPDSHGNPFLDNVPAYADPALDAYDLSTGAAVLAQTLSGTLLPVTAEVGSPAPNQIDGTWAAGFNPINGFGGIGVSQIYPDPLLGGTNVYLIGIPWANIVANVVANPCSGFYRIPCDLSATFDIIDGRRFVNYSILAGSFDPSQLGDFFSDPDDVWYPTFDETFDLEQLDRHCAGQWVANTVFYPDLTTPIPVRVCDGLYYNAGNGALYYCGLFGSNYGVVRAHICRRCLTCACAFVGLHVWQTA